MKKVKGFGFGFDLVEISKVQNYVENNFVEGEDYEMVFGMGDDVMNWLEVGSKLLEDEKFIELVGMCEGNGEFEE